MLLDRVVVCVTTAAAACCAADDGGGGWGPLFTVESNCCTCVRLRVGCWVTRAGNKVEGVGSEEVEDVGSEEVGRGEVMPMVAMMMIWQKVLSLMVDNVGLMCQMSCGTVVAVVGLLQNRG